MMGQRIEGSAGIMSRRLMICAAVLAVGFGRAEWAQSETNAAASHSQPQWELGLFGAGARLPLYRGSDEHKDYFIPMPYFVYRGKIVQVDREGVRGLFYRGKWVETDFSMGGNPPVGDDAEARRGMPELDPLIEIGPAVRGFLHRGKQVSSVYLELAARGVTSLDVSDWGFHYEGNRANLSLVLGSYSPRPGSKWLFGGRTGVDFADSSYHAYYYDVTEAQAIPGREAYQSEGGYGGFSVSGFVLRRLRPGLSASVYARWENLDGAVYEDSPMVKTENNHIIGTAITWKLAESKNNVSYR